MGNTLLCLHIISIWTQFILCRIVYIRDKDSVKPGLGKEHTQRLMGCYSWLYLKGNFQNCLVDHVVEPKPLACKVCTTVLQGQLESLTLESFVENHLGLRPYHPEGARCHLKIRGYLDVSLSVLLTYLSFFMQTAPFDYRNFL